MSLLKELEQAKAKVAQLERAVAAGSCQETGHDWQHIGGKNAGCDPDCCCSVPVYECSKCGDSDYGENSDADGIRTECGMLYLTG